MKVIERKNESTILEEFLKSNRPEFMAVYGRRRVGKTFLIKNFFSTKNCIFIPITGIQDGTFLEQRTEFCKQISLAFFNGVSLEVPESWFKCFELLNNSINKLPRNKKVVVFFDEFPWLITPRSRLLQALEYYWNQYWSNNNKIKLIVCGSLASWIIKNIINNTGGLYNRVTYRLRLEPFNLGESKVFLKNRGINLNPHQVLSLYMVTGGIPLYLEQAKKGLSAKQIIDQICFQKNGLLVNEVKELFKSLFLDSEVYIKLTREIAKHQFGITKSELASNLDMAQSGRLSERLKELEDAGFIMSFLPYQHKEKGAYFRIIDEYTAFYFRWIEPHIRSINRYAKPINFWHELSAKSAYKSWTGYVFESICYKHIPQIIQVLSLSPASLPYSWRYVSQKGKNEEGAQIDLLFDRHDNAITLCEIKYTETPFIIDKTYANIIERKINVFKKITRTNKQIFFVLISANGIKNNSYSNELIENVVILEHLFS